MLKKTLIAMALLCTLPLCCCNTTAPNDDTVTPSDDTSVADPTEQTTPTDTSPQLDNSLLGIVWEGNTEYTVIRGEFSETPVQQAAALVYNTINNTTGTRLSIKTDWVQDLSVLDHNAPEILIGTTNRTASQSVTDSLQSMTFAIRVVNNQVIITGSTDRMTTLAAEYFVEKYLSNPKYCSEGKCVLPRDLNDIQGPFETKMVDIINRNDTYTTKRKQVLTIAGFNGFRIMQGGCTDGTYCYFAMNDNDVHAVICKYDMKTWKLVKRSLPLPIDHSNDICYNPDTGKLIVVHNAPNRNTISIVDPETLTIDETIKIKHQIFSMSYNQSRKQYVVGLSGGQNFALLDQDFKTIKMYHVRSTGYTTQGVECDDDFIYFVQYNKNVIMIYDWNGRLVTRIDLDLPYVEPENISLVDNKFIIACNNSNWTGGIVYKVEIVKKSN